MDDISIEDVDDAWFWQLIDKKHLSQLCLPRNRFG
jgi:hypothetical protein